ncbi:MAG: FecR domain-containing protein, partial [Bacteroidota bacterium]
TFFETPTDLEIDESFITILENNLVASKTTVPTTATIRPMQRIKTWLVAASVLLLVGIGGKVVWKQFFQTDFPTTYAANFGELKVVNLPDGSKVHLNANSTLRLADNWEQGKDRKVWLEGEAFFEVSKQPATQAKFQVVTEGLTVEVLGTQFNVNTRQSNTSVYLKEGKIQLKLSEVTQPMAPGEIVEFSKASKKIVTAHKKADSSTGSWRTGVLTLKEQTVKEITQQMAAIYGWQVVLKQAHLANEIRTLALPIDQRQVAISILEKTLDVPVRLDGKQLIVGQ